jgi:LPXTG-motif cell wall-anchored protein
MRYLLSALALLSVLVLVMATPAVAQEEPPTPGGEPQPGAPTEPQDEQDQTAQPPASDETGGEAPASSGGTLPYTGLETLWIALAGIALLLAGARLRVVSRIRAVARRQMTPKVALRASLEELRAAGVAEARRAAQGPPPVEPSTVGARRRAKR